MFYQFRDKLTQITIDEISDEYITAGYVSAEELREIGMRYGFARSTIAACQEANAHFRSGVEVYDDYTFTELRIVKQNNLTQTEDSVALYIMKNMLLVVDVEDYDPEYVNVTGAAIEDAVIELNDLIENGNLSVDDFEFNVTEKFKE